MGMLSRVRKGSSLLDEYSGPMVRRVRYAMSTPTVLMNVLRRANVMANGCIWGHCDE